MAKAPKTSAKTTKEKSRSASAAKKQASSTAQKAANGGAKAKAAASSKPDAEQAQAARGALHAKMVAAGFGEIVSVLMRSPHYRHYSLADLEWLIVPPLLANQFTLAEARTKEGGIPSPVGVALWARVSQEVEEKLSTNLDKPLRLRPDEWTSGDRLWLIDAIGAPEAVKAMASRMSEAVFEGKPFKLRARGQDGTISVQTVGGKTKTQPKAQAEAQA